MSNVAGKWDMVVHTFLGDQFAIHEFIVNGDVLTGKVTDKGNGAQSEITDGKVDGDKFEYEFKIKIPIGNLKFHMTGEYVADGTIKGISKNAMGKFNFEATRM